MTGGRRLESDLYRVFYEKADEQNGSIASEKAPEETKEHKIRKELETYHTAPKEGTVEFAWPYLNSTDRFIQYAARIAIEHQPVSQWQERVYAEKNPVSQIQGIIALARHTDKSQRDHMLKTLTQLDYTGLSAIEQVNIVRAFELTLSRFGIPNANLKIRL